MNVLTHTCDSFPPELWLAAVFLFCNILHPAILTIVPDFQRHLRELVQIQEEIYHRNRQMQDKGGDASHGHDDSPHIDRIADQSEPGIAAGAEYTADDGGTERFADQIVGADKQHEPQVILRLRAERACESLDDRDAGKQNHAGGRSGNERDNAQLVSRLLCLRQIALPQLIADDDAGSSSDTQAQTGSQILRNLSDGIGSHRVSSQMPHDNGRHGKSAAPDDLIGKRRPCIMYVVFLKPGRRTQDMSHADPDLFLPYIFKENECQLHTTGNTRRDGGARNTKFRKAKQTENEDGVYDNI